MSRQPTAEASRQRWSPASGDNLLKGLASISKKTIQNFTGMKVFAAVLNAAAITIARKPVDSSKNSLRNRRIPGLALEDVSIAP
jgi:hypothetical protein